MLPLRNRFTQYFDTQASSCYGILADLLSPQALPSNQSGKPIKPKRRAEPFRPDGGEGGEGGGRNGGVPVVSESQAVR
jgi:hypothetical protein